VSVTYFRLVVHEVMQSMNWSYNWDVIRLNLRTYQEKSISISFDITNYGDQITLNFDEPLTIWDAIKKAEEFLNKPLTQKYLDTYNIPQKLSDFEKGTKRGDILLYRVIYTYGVENGTFVIHCGS
jgi:hypothetical protein